MLVFYFVFALLATLATSMTPVPGTIQVQLLPTNQMAAGVYSPASVVHYAVRLEAVPIDDNVHIGVEIRGSNPNGGPRGYIGMARKASPIKQFLNETRQGLQFLLYPVEIYAGYSWFFRPYLYFANESIGSSNMMNAGASKMFTVLKK